MMSRSAKRTPNASVCSTGLMAVPGSRGERSCPNGQALDAVPGPVLKPRKPGDEEKPMQMKWSRYNHMFRSERHGPFIYNSLSNRLLKLDEKHFRWLETVRKCGGVPDAKIADGADLSMYREFMDLLRASQMLVNECGDERGLARYHYMRNASCYDSNTLSLTLCPTLACNFHCAYCFEPRCKNDQVMTPKTIERLIEFVNRHATARRFTVAWYGGEPTLAWGVIEETTRRLLDLKIECLNIRLITNGYLLTGEKIDRLNELHIEMIQITLDGPREVHDQRRLLAGGRPTYDRIMENITRLFDSSYSGGLHIRVNVDRSNADAYHEYRAELRERFEGLPVTVASGHIYSGLVGREQRFAYDCSCPLNMESWVDFKLECRRRSGLAGDAVSLFPHPSPEHGVCTMNRHLGYVIGPAGEIYKCWENVGNPAMVVGDLHAEEPITNPDLRAMFAVSTDPYTDPECRTCSVLPICGGGCVNMRYLTRCQGETALDYCSPYKKNLPRMLEEYYEIVNAGEILASLLKDGKDETPDHGYRDVSPRPLIESAPPAGPAQS
jgi:uncharacterized protein